MMRHVPDIALASLAVTFAITAVLRAQPVDAGVAAVPVPPGAISTVFAVTPRESQALAQDGMKVVDANPFRLSRLPALARPTQTSTPQAAPPPVVHRPALTVIAIAGGPPWSAAIEGLPGAPSGILVREGDLHGDITIKSITGDSVTIAVRDSLMKFGLRRQLP
ncbi:MAG TPA: hypothetical protein VJR92_01320 [Gemmatimonadaceae bacterium]|nr:hypothetical protein [Gemmatimonadaceae bacterium]